MNIAPPIKNCSFSTKLLKIHTRDLSQVTLVFHYYFPYLLLLLFYVFVLFSSLRFIFIASHLNFSYPSSSYLISIALSMMKIGVMRRESGWERSIWYIFFYYIDIEQKKYLIWGLTTRIFIRVASIVYKRPPTFIKHNPKFNVPHVVSKDSSMTWRRCLYVSYCPQYICYFLHMLLLFFDRCYLLLLIYICFFYVF